MSYTAGWNAPGYLPDAEPVVFRSTRDAWEYLTEEAERCTQDFNNDDELQADVELAHRQVAAMNPNATGTVIAGERYPLAYFVTEAEPEDHRGISGYGYCVTCGLKPGNTRFVSGRCDGEPTL